MEKNEEEKRRKELIEQLTVILEHLSYEKLKAVLIILMNIA